MCWVRLVLARLGWWRLYGLELVGRRLCRLARRLCCCCVRFGLACWPIVPRWLWCVRSYWLRVWLRLSIYNYAGSILCVSMQVLVYGFSMIREWIGYWCCDVFVNCFCSFWWRDVTGFWWNCCALKNWFSCCKILAPFIVCCKFILYSLMIRVCWEIHKISGLGLGWDECVSVPEFRARMN